MIRCMIVEDELLARQVIQSHLSQTEEMELVAVCSNTLEAAEVLNRKEIDLIFLDIQLPGMTGLNFLRTLPNPPLVILTTAYSEYALESYDFNVVDYLLKPISLDRFKKAIRKMTSGRTFPALINKTEDSPEHLFIKSGTKFFKVNFSDILYIQSMKDYLKIHTKEHRLITHQTMTDMEKLLPSKQFIRVHKSYIVSVTHIRSIYGNIIEAGDAQIPIGNIYKNHVMNLLIRK
jgi:two-component system LytT family response regulator